MSKENYDVIAEFTQANIVALCEQVVALERGEPLAEDCEFYQLCKLWTERGFAEERKLSKLLIRNVATEYVASQAPSLRIQEKQQKQLQKQVQKTRVIKQANGVMYVFDPYQTADERQTRSVNTWFPNRDYVEYYMENPASTLVTAIAIIKRAVELTAWDYSKSASFGEMMALANFINKFDESWWREGDVIDMVVPCVVARLASSYTDPRDVVNSLFLSDSAYFRESNLAVAIRKALPTQ